MSLSRDILLTKEDIESKITRRKFYIQPLKKLIVGETKYGFK